MMSTADQRDPEASPRLPPGIYGVALDGLDDYTYAGRVGSDSPRWNVVVSVAPIDAEGSRRAPPESIQPDRALLRYGDGATVRVERNATGADVRLGLTRDIPHREVLHPYLSSIGMLSAYWGGGLALHAGAVGLGSGAWLFVGGKGSGKSTTMAKLAVAGHPVLADDQSVLDDRFVVQSGPRFIDLRREIAEDLGIGEDIGVLGVRRRWRHPIGAAPPTMPLAGVVVPAWGPPGLTPIRGSARLAALAPGVSLRVPGPWDELFMDLALSFPVLQWTRPRDILQVDDHLERLVDQLAD